jgi:ribosomal protein S12 methylthiotransferase accessory factor
VFDLSGPLPVAGAILVDLDDGPIPVTAGYACAPDALAAIRGAILEAAQSRLTDVHGAREDVVAPDSASMRALRAACERARPRHAIGEMPSGRSLRSALRGQRIALVELAREPLHVVKIFAPELRVSELL